MTEHNKIQPTASKPRIRALDFLRGFAILGILVMNVQSFSMPGAAYLNPTAYGDLTGANKWVWILSHLFADQKFMTIFSILFGAGVVLFSSNAERKTGHSAALHYRRTFWLLMIGLIHGHLIWYGDILVPYALCGFVVYLLRNLRPGILFAIGLGLIAVHTVLYLFFGLTIEYWPPESMAAMQEMWLPGAEQIRAEINAYTGSFVEQMKQRSTSALALETTVFLLVFVWRAGGLMLVGMALYKWGILTAEKSLKFYTRGWIISWLVGLPMIAFGIFQNFRFEWTMEYGMFLDSQWNYWGSLPVGFGFICLVMLLENSSALELFKDRLAAVGQMALTNYIGQSVLCTLIFYGIGLGYFGQFERTGQIILMLVIWVLQIVYSRLWLNRFRFGPLEWLWRSATYRQWQPLNRTHDQ